MTIVVARVDRDYIAEPGETKRVGVQFTSINQRGEKVRFRVLDGDGEVYYGGWLLNDEHGNNQLAMLRWAERDAGCTTIEVKIGGEWVQEIG